MMYKVKTLKKATNTVVKQRAQAPKNRARCEEARHATSRQKSGPHLLVHGKLNADQLSAANRLLTFDQGTLELQPRRR